ncbi:NAD-dependent epimerase/dehydratase [Tanacetum coccineum]
MKVLVTGASGFLGGRLCHVLLRQGHSVRAFVRRSSDLSSLPAPSQSVALEIAYGYVTDYTSVLEACSGYQVVFHVAASLSCSCYSRLMASGYFHVNVGGLKHVLRAYKETDTIEKIVYTSSFFALGSTDGYIVDETQMHLSKYFCREYEKLKTIADKIALDAPKEGVPMVSVCPGVMYGPGKITLGNVLARTFVERLNGRLPGYLGDGNTYEPLAIPLDEIQIDDKLNFIEEPIEIMDREVKWLKQSRIPIMKVCWNSRRGPEFTWEREDQMKKKYPHLFVNP